MQRYFDIAWTSFTSGQTLRDRMSRKRPKVLARDEEEYVIEDDSFGAEEEEADPDQSELIGLIAGVVQEKMAVHMAKRDSDLQDLRNTMQLLMHDIRSM